MLFRSSERHTVDIGEVEPTGVLPGRQQIVPQIGVSVGYDPVVVSVVEARHGLRRPDIRQQTGALVYSVHVPAQALNVVLQSGGAVPNDVDAALRVAEDQVVLNELNGPGQVASNFGVDGGEIGRASCRERV